jgi:hypothetical protein
MIDRLNRPPKEGRPELQARDTLMEMISFHFCRHDDEKALAFRRRTLRMLNEHHIVLPDDIENLLHTAIDDHQHDVTVLVYGGPGPATATIHRRGACWAN